MHLLPPLMPKRYAQDAANVAAANDAEKDAAAVHFWQKRKIVGAHKSILTGLVFGLCNDAAAAKKTK